MPPWAGEGEQKTVERGGPPFGVPPLGNASGNCSEAKRVKSHVQFGEVLRASGPLAKANPIRFSSKFQRAGAVRVTSRLDS